MRLETIVDFGQDGLGQPLWFPDDPGNEIDTVTDLGQ